MISCVMRAFRGVLRVACVWGIALSVAGAAELDSGVQKQLRAATFEVVQLKPAEGEVAYERPLPLDLIPFQQRNDKYRSIGTAFAVAPNRYVTAGHVILAGVASQYGAPALRDSAGKVYEIDQVLAYSSHEDFVVFSLREGPRSVPYLKPGSKPSINDTVFAVGNALGQGIVIRDGVYTSDTPEEQDGKWNWIRFTAAASPGNSGGPLVDRRGRLVGVVLRKSPSENLNYALAIGQVLESKEGEGRMSQRSALRLPILDASEPEILDEHFALPLTLPEFYKTWMNTITGVTQRTTAKLLENNQARLFPRGAGSERLLHVIERAPLPLRLREAQNGVWVAGGAKPQTSQLDHNGYVEIGGTSLRVRTPDDIGLAKLYGDSKLLMDLLLKAHSEHRQIGSDSVRVTSLGKASRETTYTDRYGRVWQIKTWAIPYDDAYFTAVLLPTPEGYAGVFFRAPSMLADTLLREEELLLDYVLVTMEGTLAQWRDYLAQKVDRPKVFDSLQLQIDGTRQVRLHSRHYELEVTPALVKLSDQSILRLNFGFFHDGDQVVWDVAGLLVGEGEHTANWVNAQRKSQPPADLPEGFQSDWHKLVNHDFPYNGAITTESGETRAATAVGGVGGGNAAKVWYALRVGFEGSQPQDLMTQKLDLLQRSFKVLEN